MVKFKCDNCFHVIQERDLDEDGNCPVCHEPVIEMCDIGPIRCEHDVVDGIAFCHKCGGPICPVCECHNVSQISRVTGYLSSVAGWNEAKKQELKDRTRYNLAGTVVERKWER